MKQVKISVVIPTYKRPALLINCLHQLINQDLDKQEYEVIVVADGMDVETQKVVQRLSSETNIDIQFQFLPQKKGPAAARNMGWKRAKADLIAFTDDDCLPDKNWLPQILSNYHGQQHIAFTGRVVVPVSDDPTDFEMNTKGLETGEFVTANCVVTRAALTLVGGFDERFTTAWREDSDLHFNLLKNDVPLIYLHVATVVHPVRYARWGVSLKEQKKSRFNALLYKKYPDLFRQRIRAKPAWNYYLIILFFFLFLTGVMLQIKPLMLIGFTAWVCLTAGFIFKRLKNSRKTGSHIFEMIVTSILIPFLSVYWTLFGSIKYRVLFF